MQTKSYAKINWTLRITSRRADGYHELETLFQTISLYDTITLMESDAWTITCDDPEVPCDERNLIMQAAHLIQSPPLYIALQKRIPAGGGLGGGSSNAAATLCAIDQMFNLRTPPNRMREFAAQLGSDVPFFLERGLAYATGRGEQLTQLQGGVSIPLLLIFPSERVSTAEAYSLIKTYSQPLGLDAYRSMLRGDFLSNASKLVNDFEGPIFARMPRLRDYRERLLRKGALWAHMTGSGSTIVGAFRDQASRDAAQSEFWDVRNEPATTLTSGS